MIEGELIAVLVMRQLGPQVSHGHVSRSDRIMMEVSVIRGYFLRVSRIRYVFLMLAAMAAAVFSIFTPAPALAMSNTCGGVQEQPWVRITQPTLPSSATAPNCRYGAAASAKGASELAAMQIGWLVSFGASEPSWLPPNVAHTPMIRLQQNRDAEGKRLPTYTADPTFTENGLGQLILANPGATWIVGNEVDREIYQDDLMPEVYATAYHDAYQFIKQQDPTAQVATSALVLVSPGRIQYLDKVLDAYRKAYGATMPVDVWTFHAYLFAERNDDYMEYVGEPVFAGIANGTDLALALKNPYPYPNRPIEERLELCQRDDYLCIYQHDNLDLFVEQVVEMRIWMKARGYQNTPLLLSEWSQLHPYVPTNDGTCFHKDEFGDCFTPPRVTDFMETSVPYLESAIDPNLGYPPDNFRLVQQWAWFPLDDLGGSYTKSNPSILIDPSTGELSQMGRKYRELIGQTTTQANLVIDQVFVDLADVDPETGTAVAELKVSIRNNGNTPTTAPFDVRFFRDSGLTQEIGRIIIPGGLAGCAVTDAVAEIEWEGLGAGFHPYWVLVDGDNAIGPGDPKSKTGSSFVLVDPKQTFLPTLQR